MTVIECTNVTKSYGRFKALDNLSFSIEENKITGLIGRNGAGKTTLLKLLAGYFHETSGEVRVFNERPFNNLLVSANSILVDDEMAFPDALNLGEILNEAGRFYAKWDMRLAKRLFNYFSFDEKQFHKNLSKGKESTFNMIVGLASRCALTIFDEPTTGMDAAVRKDFYRALLKDYLDHPRTIIISSHHLEEVEDLLEDVLLLNDGEKYLHLPIEELKEYAIGISGDPDKMNAYIEGKHLIYKETISSDSVYIVVKNDYPQQQIDKMGQAGLKLTQINPNDLSVHLTNKQTGGIDDVFN